MLLKKVFENVLLAVFFLVTMTFNFIMDLLSALTITALYSKLRCDNSNQFMAMVNSNYIGQGIKD